MKAYMVDVQNPKVWPNDYQNQTKYVFLAHARAASTLRESRKKETYPRKLSSPLLLYSLVMIEDAIQLYTNGGGHYDLLNKLLQVMLPTHVTVFGAPWGCFVVCEYEALGLGDHHELPALHKATRAESGGGHTGRHMKGEEAPPASSMLDKKKAPTPAGEPAAKSSLQAAK
ncbi:hypothetical protein Pelo_8171 [Pelomyxa schiedti]|nr:hypothetical protein Pelo_8171 [Pelomyxa schiedti]